MTTTTTTKTHAAEEAVLRRKARRLGVQVLKRRGHYFGDPYWIVDPWTRGLLTMEYGLSLSELATWIDEAEQAQHTKEQRNG